LATSPSSSVARVTHAIQSGLEGLASRALRGFGKIGIGTSTDARLPGPFGIPQQAPAPAPSGVSDQEIVRRARALHLPPAAVEVLRQEFRASSAPAQVEPERSAVSGGI
jgi:hypothetical protein